MATPASAGSPAPRGPQVINPWLQRVDAGEAELVSVWFRGMDRRICDVKMVVRGGRQVDVSYPRHRRFASLSHGDMLTRGERDRATFRVEADFRRDANAILAATVSYNDCGRHSRTEIKRFGLLLPVDGGTKGHDWGNGSGNGHGPVKGHGAGHGNGSGWGNGSGHGSGWGNGNGSGHGSGSGSGHGNGNGSGHGNGWGNGNGSGHGNGPSNGNGSGHSNGGYKGGTGDIKVHVTKSN